MDEVENAHAKVDFSLTWIALKLLGKDLYSHPWSAVSELVANGIDADASEVRVHIDLSRGKEAASLEIFDNGVGMDEDDLKIYTRIGHNKRSTPQRSSRPAMGRKGIGKLAALYLSDHYRLITKKIGENPRAWELDASKDMDDDSHPALSEVPLTSVDNTYLYEHFFNESSSGTLIQIIDINLRGFGERAFEGLNKRLANHFQLTKIDNCSVYFAMTSSGEETPEFDLVTKEIASKNFLFFMPLSSEETSLEISPKPITVEISGTETHITPSIKRFQSDSIPTQGTYDSKLLASLSEVAPSQPIPNGLKYRLEGWIGMHASINGKIAESNDATFIKNSFYNPIQLRLYVRNKLAVDNILPLLGSTQTYANYLEGEINFDILDDDSLPDIATTSREGFDFTDPRIMLLQKLLQQAVRELINARNTLNNETKQKRKEKQNTAKQELLLETSSKLRNANLSPTQVADITHDLQMKLEGDGLAAKSEYLIFLSHRRTDAPFATLLWRIMKHQGARNDEVFFTSRNPSKDSDRNRDIIDLQELMKRNITNANTRIVYVITPRFTDSDYCMFEAGAGWATRTPPEFDLLTSHYNHVPQYLLSQRTPVNFVDQDGRLLLNRETYTSLIDVANRLIDHLNEGRRFRNEDLIPHVEENELPEDAELIEANKKIEEFYNPTIKQFFKTAIETWEPLNPEQMATRRS